MKKIISVLLSFILLFSVVSVTVTTYAEEWNEEKSINNFIDGIVGLSREYDTDKEFEIVEDKYTYDITVNQFYSNGAISETKELVKYIGSMSSVVIASAVEVALTLIGSSVGELIAKALDYIDPWWKNGYKRNNGYVFN